MNFEQIPTILKRYSFSEKMEICQKCSQKIMQSSPYYIDPKKIVLQNLPQTWDLETFALFSIMTEKEYQYKTFKDIEDQRIFIEIINAIKSYCHPSILSNNDPDYWLMGLSQFQFKEQTDIHVRLFRYNYIFSFKNNDLDMPEIFKNFFKATYADFYLPALLIYNLFVYPSNAYKLNEAIDKIFFSYNKIFKFLVIKRSAFILEQNKCLLNGINSYQHSFKFFYPYPFINYKEKTYLPLPYLIVDAITDSLFRRLTHDNLQLLQKIGEFALQNYLEFILKESLSYDEIKPEIKYYCKTEYRTPDVMVRKGHVCILFDSKLSLTTIRVRDFDIQTINNIVEKYASSIVQIYNRIREFNLYNPFSIKNFEKKDVFGVIVLFDDSYVSRANIYKRAIEKLGIKMDSNEYKFILTNIKIVNIEEIEQTAFHLTDYISTLVLQRDNYNANLFSMNPYKIDLSSKKGILPAFISFRDNTYVSLDKIVNKLNIV